MPDYTLNSALLAVISFIALGGMLCMVYFQLQKREVDNLSEHYSPVADRKVGIEFLPPTLKNIDQEKYHSRIALIRGISKRTNENLEMCIAELERHPAYTRRYSLSEIQTWFSTVESVSRYTVASDENNRAEIRKNNSFLHDSVD